METAAMSDLDTEKIEEVERLEEIIKKQKL